ncbi:MAG: hypothetical protein K9W44_11630 [Candidatus Lokiarchaeota archaeon]|nr:hypothetical protein [Candidatus Harpocratesius repetitus]
MIKLNENKRERHWGYFFMGIYIFIFLFYLFFDGWHFEWLHYGYSGANQHFDFNIFGDMQWDIINGERVYYSTNNLHNLVYICYWTGTISYLALITGNKWLRQGSVATMAFPVISAFSTINPFVASDIFTWDIFYYHSYILQIIYDLNHLCGIIMGIYNYNALNKNNENINFKKITPTILFTWLLFILARIFLQKWPYWAPGNELGMISTNQINNMPFVFYGLEYIIVIALLYFINGILYFVGPRIKRTWVRTLAQFLVFAIITIIFVQVGLIELQVIPYTAFVQY